jgi:hypothetical protein
MVVEDFLWRHSLVLMIVFSLIGIGVMIETASRRDFFAFRLEQNLQLQMQWGGYFLTICMYTPALLFTSAALYPIEQTGSAEFPLVDAVDPIVTEKHWALFIQTSSNLLLVRDTTYSHIPASCKVGIRSTTSIN